MSCVLCGPRPSQNLQQGQQGPYLHQQGVYRICHACFLATVSLIDSENGSDILQINSSGSPANQNKGIGNVLKSVKEMRQNIGKLKGRVKFLGGFAGALKEGCHADISVRPGSNGPAIPAHKALLATRSEIFKNMLDSDKCKAPAEETITLNELNHEQLEAFLEFLYTGDLPKSTMEKHVYSLSIAADKYAVTFLQKFCEDHMLVSMSTSNVLEILEIADTCSYQALKDAAMKFIVKNMENVISSPRFDEFALKNPHLSVKITRAYYNAIKTRNGTGTSSAAPQTRSPSSLSPSAVQQYLQVYHRQLS